MWPLKSILYFGVFWIACVMALANPIWGVLNYMVVYQTDPTNTWWGQPLAELGMRFSLLAAGSTVLGLLLGRKHVPDVRPAFSAWEWGVLALFVIASLNIVIGVEFGATATREFTKFWKVLLFTLILTRLASVRKNLLMVMWALVIGCLYLGYDAYTAPSWAFLLGRLETFGGPDFSTSSGAAAHLSAMLPIIGTAFLTAKHWKWKLLAAVSGALTVNAVIMCRTRSAFIGLVVGLLAAFLAAPRVRRYRIHALLFAGSVLAFGLTDEHFWARMGTLADQEVLETDLATVSRKEIWLASLQIIADYPLGVGVGNFTRVIGDYDVRHTKRSSHNSLIVCFAELGVQGGIVFLSMVALSVRLLHRSSKLAGLSDKPLETKMLAYGFLIALVTYFTTALGTQRFYCESFWWVLALPLCLYRAVLAEADARVGIPAPVASVAGNEEMRVVGQLQSP